MIAPRRHPYGRAQQEVDRLAGTVDSTEVSHHAGRMTLLRSTILQSVGQVELDEEFQRVAQKYWTKVQDAGRGLD